MITKYIPSIYFTINFTQNLLNYFGKFVIHVSTMVWNIDTNWQHCLMAPFRLIGTRIEKSEPLMGGKIYFYNAAFG
jgi:hypothetical protein